MQKTPTHHEGVFCGFSPKDQGLAEASERGVGMNLCLASRMGATIESGLWIIRHRLRYPQSSRLPLQSKHIPISTAMFSTSEVIDLLEEACELCPEGDIRLLYVDGFPLKTPAGHGLYSKEIKGRPALEALGITDVEIAYEFLLPGEDRSKLDQSVPWQISFNRGVDTVPCNVRAITQDPLGPGWNILVDTARRELLPNLLITWQKGLGSFTTESSSGNPIEATEAVETYAVLSQRNPTRNIKSPGNDPARFYLEGYFCDSQGNPVNTPDGFQWQRAWPAVWTDGLTGLQHHGNFTAALTTETPLKNRPVDIGSQLQGWFVSQGTGAIGVV